MFRYNKQCQSKLWKWCQIGIVLVLLIILVTLIYILIFKPENKTQLNEDAEYIDGSLMSNEKRAGSVLIPTADKSTPPVVLPLVVNISSSLHLRGITPDTRTVVIYNLKPLGTPSGIIKDPNVTTLDLRGPVDLHWLNYVLNSLPSLKNLYVDVDEVCSGFSLSPNNDTVKGVIKLPKLELLVAVNSKACGVLQWDALTYEFPQLKQIKIKRAVLSVEPPHFQALTSLFNQTKTSIEGLEVTESYICDSCDLTEVEFPRLKWIKIMQRSSTNPFESKKSMSNEGGEEEDFHSEALKKSAGLQVGEDKNEDSNESYWDYDEELY